MAGISLLIVKFSERENSQSPNEFTFGYLGTVGTWYLFDETVKAFKSVSYTHLTLPTKA